MSLVNTNGYVGTIEVEDEDTDRIWFSLVDHDTNGDWVELNGIRAWFQCNIELGQHSRTVHFAKLALLFEAMREGYEIEVKHPADAHTDIARMVSNDTYDATSVRALRLGIHF